MNATFTAQPITFTADERKPLGPPSAVPLTGEIMTASRLLGTALGNKILTGTWECEPGTSRWEFIDRGEVIHVLSGRMTCAADDGDTVEVTAGSTALFPLGWKASGRSPKHSAKCSLSSKPDALHAPTASLPGPTPVVPPPSA